jgi:pimeloyl-ACP methyl ester carboxylesterase
MPVVPVPMPRPRDVAEESALSALAPVERLGRFDGESFEEIELGSIPPSHLYVLVHGWAPGWGERVRDDPELRCWESPSCEPWMRDLARALERADPHAVVVAYSWLDNAATGRFILAQRRALAHTELHGRALAEAISITLADDFYERSGRVHLIGHSYGARVAALAAAGMPELPQQITIFDSPDAPLTHIMGGQTGLTNVLSELPIGRDRGEVFVDNYISMVGSPYRHEPGLSEVVDVVLVPPYHAFDYSGRHLYPMRFYEQTGDLDIALGWSSMLGRPPRAGCYEQVYGELALRRGCAGVP